MFCRRWWKGSEGVGRWGKRGGFSAVLIPPEPNETTANGETQRTNAKVCVAVPTISTFNGKNVQRRLRTFYRNIELKRKFGANDNRHSFGGKSFYSSESLFCIENTFLYAYFAFFEDFDIGGGLWWGGALVGGTPPGLVCGWNMKVKVKGHVEYFFFFYFSEHRRALGWSWLVSGVWKHFSATIHFLWVIFLYWKLCGWNWLDSFFVAGQQKENIQYVSFIRKSKNWNN